MTPESLLASERTELERVKALPRIQRSCEYHGFVMHFRDDEEFWCLPCAVERVDSMADALGSRPESEPEEGEAGYRCPSCHELYDSKCRTPADAVCFACRYPE